MFKKSFKKISPPAGEKISFQQVRRRPLFRNSAR
jgi:hypothetical protein